VDEILRGVDESALSLVSTGVDYDPNYFDTDFLGPSGSQVESPSGFSFESLVDLEQTEHSASAATSDLQPGFGAPLTGSDGLGTAVRIS
jgi:hypothetical protein